MNRLNLRDVLRSLKGIAKSFPAAPSTEASWSGQTLINTKVGNTGMGRVGAIQIIIAFLQRLLMPTDTILAASALHKFTTISAYTFKARLPTVLTVLIHRALADWGRLTHSTMTFLILFTIFAAPAFYWWRRWRWRQHTITVEAHCWCRAVP